MKLSEPIEESGFFWLPEESERKLPGVFRISESGEATLEITSLSHPVTSALGKHQFGDPWLGEEGMKFKRVLGLIKKGPVTLEDCSCFDSNYQLLGGLTTLIISPSFTFIGVGYGDEIAITFSELKFSLEGLDEWLGVYGIHIAHEMEKGRLKSTSVNFALPEEITLHLAEEMELKFSFDASVPSGFNTTEARISQRAYIRLKSKKLRPLDDFLSLMFKLHHFFCFAVDETISLTSVIGYSSDITRGKKNNEIPIEIYFKSTLSSKNNPKIHRIDMLFRYRDVSDKFHEILTNWLERHEVYMETFNEYFTSRYGAYKYLEGEFLSLVRGIEAFHRKNSQDTEMPEEQFRDMVSTILKYSPNENREWIERKLRYSNELSLQKRMKKMLEPFKRFYGNEVKRKSFVNKVVNTRNYLIHFDESLAKDAAEREELWKLRMKLEALFQLHLLKLIGMDSTLIDNIVNENSNLRSKLEITENNHS